MPRPLSVALALSVAPSSLACAGVPTPILEQRLAAGRTAGPLVVTDADGDGHLDIVVGSVGVFLGDGTGRFASAPHSILVAGESPNDIALADFDGDGRRDLAFANHEARHLTVLLNAGEGRFEPAPGSPVAVDSRPHVHSVAAADWNGDGRTDLVVDSWEDQHVQVLLGDGGGRFRPGPRSEAGNLCCFPRLRAADLDGDGWAELLLVNPPDDRLRVLVSDGQGGFPAARAVSFEVSPRASRWATSTVTASSMPWPPTWLATP